ncbi:DUF6234 family protein [Streptomyces virginiae]|uniref:DUF6234 family protein n=1 Tax=Streptomyces virginiae TaxID=1961 RepID=UPI0036A11C84
MSPRGSAARCSSSRPVGRALLAGRAVERAWPGPADLAIGIPLLSLGAGWLVLDAVFGHGLETWAAQGDLGRIETADLASMARIQAFLVVVLVVVLLALVSRAPWTVLSQVLLAILAGVVPVAAQHSWDRSHPASTASTGSVSEDAGSRHREHNAFRMSGEMSPASAQDARREADRVEPVLERLWRSGAR